MGNLFDSTNYSETEPAEIIAGDSTNWKRTDLGDDYAPASYALTYTARLEDSGSTSIAITASESGNDYIVEIAAATSAAYTVGIYHWQAYITRSSDSERITIDHGTFEVKPNRATATTDPRTYVKISLDAIEAVIQGRASKDQAGYSIDGRTLSRTPIPELLLLYDRFKALWKGEQRAEKIKNGEGHAGRILTRFK